MRMHDTITNGKWRNLLRISDHGCKDERETSREPCERLSQVWSGRGRFGEVSRFRWWPKSNLDRNLSAVASRGRRDSFQAAQVLRGSDRGIERAPGHLSLPLWCQSRHPGRDDDYGHLTPCRVDFSIVLDPLEETRQSFRRIRWLTRWCSRARGSRLLQNRNRVGLSAGPCDLYKIRCEFSWRHFGNAQNTFRRIREVLMHFAVSRSI